MSPNMLLHALLRLLCVCLAVATAVEEVILEVKSVLDVDVTLQCTAKAKPDVEYIAVRWYKVREPPSQRLSGLLTKDLPNGSTRWYIGAEREVKLLGESRDILLPNVTCGDSSVYMCHLLAPVGEQNQEGHVLLTVTDCPSETLLTDTYLVIFAGIVLLLALLIFLISYCSLKNVLRDRNRTTTMKETLLEANKPLDEKDLKLIYTLGPKVPLTMKHFCV